MGKLLDINALGIGQARAPRMVQSCLPPMISNRRRHERYPLEAPLRVWSIASGSRNAYRGQCVNLTEAGAGAIIAGPWAPGQVVTMELVLPGASEVTLQARMRYRNHLICGFEFLGTSGQVVEELRRVCASPDQFTQGGRLVSPLPLPSGGR